MNRMPRIISQKPTRLFTFTTYSGLMTMDVDDEHGHVGAPAGSDEVRYGPIFWEGDRLRRRISDDLQKGRKRQRIGDDEPTMAALMTASALLPPARTAALTSIQGSTAVYSSLPNHHMTRRLVDKRTNGERAASASIPITDLTGLPDADVNVNVNPPHVHHRVSLSPSNSNRNRFSNSSSSNSNNLRSQFKPPMDQVSSLGPISLEPNETSSAEADVKGANTGNSPPHIHHASNEPSMTDRFDALERDVATWRMGTKGDSPTATATRRVSVQRATVILVLCLVVSALYFYVFSSSPTRLHGHLIPPTHGLRTQVGPDGTTTTLTVTDPIPTGRTLRDYLTDDAGFYLAIAPSFFGFYGYFGALAAWEEGIDASILSGDKIHAVAGASSGAIAAILIAAGIKPRRAADMCAGMTLGKFADFPAVGALFRGNKFEQIMFDFMRSEQPEMSLLLQDAILPVAVTAFDLQTMEGQILSTGSMARAARASATVPGLFQPVGWKGDVAKNETEDYMLIDGGCTDYAGVHGLAVLVPDQPKRVVNMVVGQFTHKPPGPSAIAGSTEVLSISLQNLPMCGPFHMANGPIALDAAHRAMMATLDLPIYQGKDANHFELHIDTGPFWKGKKLKEDQ